MLSARAIVGPLLLVGVFAPASIPARAGAALIRVERAVLPGATTARPLAVAAPATTSAPLSAAGLSAALQAAPISPPASPTLAAPAADGAVALPAALAAAIEELRGKSYVVVPARQWLPPATAAELQERMRSYPKNVESFYGQGRTWKKLTADAQARVMDLFEEIERGLNAGLSDEGPFKLVNVRAHYAPYLTGADGVSANTRGKHLDSTKITAALTLHPSRGDAGTAYVDENGVERHVQVGDLLLFSGELRPKVRDGLLAALLHGSPDFPGKRLALFAFYNDSGFWHR